MGVLGGLRLKVVVDAVNTQNFNKAGYAFLLSKNGTIISHPKAESRMQKSRDSASKTAEEAGAANEMLARIRQAIVHINDMNTQIATAAEEQSATTEEINRNTTNIRDISHEVAAGAEEQVRQCALMVEQVGEQGRLLGRFNV